MVAERALGQVGGAGALRPRALTKCLGEIEVTLGSFRARRTYPSSQPLLQNTSAAGLAPLRPAAECVFSVDPPQDLPLSSSTAEAVQSVRPQGSASSRLVQSATHSCDSKPLSSPQTAGFRGTRRTACDARIRAERSNRVRAGAPKRRGTGAQRRRRRGGRRG